MEGLYADFALLAFFIGVFVWSKTKAGKRFLDEND
jgi:hypothetical protein